MVIKPTFSFFTCKNVHKICKNNFLFAHWTQGIRRVICKNISLPLSWRLKSQFCEKKYNLKNYERTELFWILLLLLIVTEFFCSQRQMSLKRFCFDQNSDLCFVSSRKKFILTLFLLLSISPLEASFDHLWSEILTPQGVRVRD